MEFYTRPGPAAPPPDRWHPHPLNHNNHSICYKVGWSLATVLSWPEFLYCKGLLKRLYQYTCIRALTLLSHTLEGDRRSGSTKFFATFNFNYRSKIISVSGYQGQGYLFMKESSVLKKCTPQSLNHESIYLLRMMMMMMMLMSDVDNDIVNAEFSSPGWSGPERWLNPFKNS